MSTMGFVSTLKGAGAAGALSLDFASQSYSVQGIKKDFSDVIAFSRASAAGRTNEKGEFERMVADQPRLDYDPLTKKLRGLLVEEARTNLSLFSTRFENVWWGNMRTTNLPNCTVAPDGSLTACKLVEDTTTNSHGTNRAFVPVADAAYTWSVYVKAAERIFARVTFGSFANQVESNDVNVNLLTGEFTAADLTRARVEAAGNGWWRVSVTVIANGNGHIAPAVYILPTLNVSKYVGDGVSGIYIWGGQTEQASFPTSFIPTLAAFISRSTTATYIDRTGMVKTAAANIARDNSFAGGMDGKLLSTGTLLEPAGTNLVLQSQAFNTAAWLVNGSLVTGAISPAGDATAFQIKEPVGTASNKGVRQNGVFNSVVGTSYTFSAYAKLAPGSPRLFSLAYGSSSLAEGLLSASFDLETGTVYSVTGGTARMEKLANGWYRVSFTVTATLASVVNIFPRLAVGPSFAYEGDGVSGVYLWGVQVETGGYPTSYIETGASAVTRAADISTSSETTRAADVVSVPLSPWYNQTEGAFLIEYNPGTIGAGGTAVGIHLNSTTDTLDRVSIRKGTVVGELRAIVNSSDGTLQASRVGATGLADGARVMAGLSLKTNNISFSANGAAPAVDTVATMPAPTRFFIGSTSNGTQSANGIVKSVAYYPAALSSAQLQMITS